VNFSCHAFLCEIPPEFLPTRFNQSQKVAGPSTADQPEQRSEPLLEELGIGKSLAARKKNAPPFHALWRVGDWLRSVEPIQRTRWTRENNTIVARELLPFFEAEPSGWDALPALNLCKREPDKTLKTFLEEWRANADATHRPFVDKVSHTLIPPG
jgi:hypothetical protein